MTTASKTLGVSLLLLLFAGCTSTPLGYPDGWSPMQSNSSACPDLAGIYAQVGEATSGCAAGDSCARLSYDLIAGIPGLEDKASVAGTQVQLRQPSPAVLDIIVREGERELGGVSLSAARGDFRCTPHGLALVPRANRVFVVGGSSYREQRTFNRASDGSLVMLREALAGGEGVTVPFGEHSRYWVRWPQGGR